MRHSVWFKTNTNTVRGFPLLGETKPSVLAPCCHALRAIVDKGWVEEIMACMKTSTTGGPGQANHDR